MYILALDTSSNITSIAVTENQAVLAERTQVMERGQGEALMPMIEEVLAEAGHDIQDINAVAVAVGPGSFTGVRIGLAAAKGIGLALDVPVWGVTNFESSAYGIANPVTVLLDSKRDDYFAQDFDNGVALTEPTILSTAQLKEKDSFCATGNGAEKIAQETDGKCQVVSAPVSSAVAVARIAFDRAENPMPAEPVYLREADVTL